jgi:hypothetical protein
VSDWLWLLAGFLVGMLNVAAIARTVGQLRPDGNVRALFTVVGGFALRLLLSMFVLVVALRQSVVAGLLAFTGIWLGRWTALFWTNTSANRRRVKA